MVETKFCIVGSGAAGAILAVELAKTGKQVLVIEAGNESPYYSVETMLNDIKVSGDIDVHFGFSCQVGGATNLWAGRVTPFEAIDLQQREWVPNSGWPFSLSELDQYYMRASHILGLDGVGNFDRSQILPDSFLGIQDIKTKKFLWAKTPFNARDYLCDNLAKFSNLRVMENSRVIKVIKDADNKTVSAIEIVSEKSGERSLVEFGIFILAAGGIETPRILLHSGIGGDCVGRYFSTHPKADMAVLRLKKRVTLNHPLFLDTKSGGGTQRLGLGFSEECQEREHLLNHYVQLSPMAEYKATKMFEVLKGSPLLKSKFIDRSKIMSGILPSVGHFFYDLIGRIAGWQKRSSMFVLRGFLDQFPVPENRVTLSERLDKYGTPLANVQWEFTQKDRDSVLLFFEGLDRRFRQAGIGRVEFSEMKGMKEWPLIGIHSHFMGATRMGHDPQTSVTDANAQVHGMENLFIAGPSLFPTYGYANPVYTIAALSLKLGDYLSACVNKA